MFLVVFKSSFVVTLIPSKAILAASARAQEPADDERFALAVRIRTAMVYQPNPLRFVQAPTASCFFTTLAPEYVNFMM